MNIQKLVAIVVAVLINCAVLAWFHAWSAAIVANAAVSPAQVQKVITLPTITVRPTPAQLKWLRQQVAPATTSRNVPDGAGTGGIQALVMPYYSFADDPGAARGG